MDALISIDTDGIGKAVVRVVDAIENAMRGDTIASRKVTMARASADALVIQTDAEIETEDRKRIAQRRVVAEVRREQDNLERVIQRSLPHIREDANPAEVEADWITHLLNQAKQTSNADVQELWAKVLAGEMNSPGTFYRRTINIIAELERAEAKIFEHLCRFVWTLEAPWPLIYDYADEFYRSRGIRYLDMLKLESAGLVSLGQGFRIMDQQGPRQMSYFGQRVIMNFPVSLPANPKSAVNSISAGLVKLTDAGIQLQSLVSAEPIPEFLDYVLHRHKSLHPQLLT